MFKKNIFAFKDEQEVLKAEYDKEYEKIYNKKILFRRLGSFRPV